MVPERSKARGKRSRHLGSGCPGRALLPQVFLKYQPTSHRQQFINNYLFVAATLLSSFIKLAICQSHKHDSLNLIYLCRLRILALIARVYWRRVEKKSAKGKSRPASLYNVSSFWCTTRFIYEFLQDIGIPPCCLRQNHTGASLKKSPNTILIWTWSKDYGQHGMPGCKMTFLQLESCLL